VSIFLANMDTSLFGHALTLASQCGGEEGDDLFFAGDDPGQNQGILRGVRGEVEGLRDEVLFRAGAQTFGTFFNDISDHEHNELVTLILCVFFHVGEKAGAKGGEGFRIGGIDLGDSDFVAVKDEFFQVLSEDVLGGAVLQGGGAGEHGGGKGVHVQGGDAGQTSGGGAVYVGAGRGFEF